MGEDPTDDKEVVSLGWVVRWRGWGIEYDADPKHRRMLLDHFGFDGGHTRG